MLYNTVFRTLLMGLAINYHKHCRSPFGTNVQEHKEDDSSLRSRTSGAIALLPTGNERGVTIFYFLNLNW